MERERVLCVVVRAPVASFRRPLDHNYQRTLLMPPPTTIVGLAGAAMGLGDKELWADDGIGRRLKVAVCMDSEPGRARDMWTLLKITGRTMIRAPYLRELLYGVRYTLIYGAETADLKRLEDAFKDPAYPLSLGREDELLEVEEVVMKPLEEGESVFSGTALPCDIRQTNAHLHLEPGIRIAPPQVESLPLSFRVDARRIRHPENFRQISFIPPSMQIEVPSLQAWRYEDGRSFVWTNS